MSNKSFTLMELLIVVVIIGIIAGFAIPGYEKAMIRQKVKRLIITANLIAGAQEIYRAKNGQYACFAAACPSLVEINSGLEINVVPEAGVSYLAAAAFMGDSVRTIISDGVLFRIDVVSNPGSPAAITCTDLPATPVCP